MVAIVEMRNVENKIILNFYRVEDQKIRYLKSEKNNMNRLTIDQWHLSSNLQISNIVYFD
jgi:hypothetical protein